jgi:hypothetical protein
MSGRLINTECATCHIFGRVPSEWHGRKVRCKHCGSSFVVSPLQDCQAELEATVAKLSSELERLREAAATEASKRKEAEEALRGKGFVDRQNQQRVPELHVEHQGKKYTWSGVTWYGAEDYTIPPLAILNVLNAHLLGNAHSRTTSSCESDPGIEAPPNWDLCYCRDDLSYCVECANWHCVSCGRGCQCDEEWDGSYDPETDAEDEIGDRVSPRDLMPYVEQRVRNNRSRRKEQRYPKVGGDRGFGQ